MSYVKNLSRLGAVILAVTFMSCITYQEPTWATPHVEWSKSRLPLKVSSYELDGYIPDIKAAIDVWNSVAGCQIMVYKDTTNPDIALIMDEAPHRHIVTRVFFRNSPHSDTAVVVYVYRPHAGGWPYLVFAHSLGRALGLAEDPYHRNSIMYGYADDYTLYSRVREADRRALRERYCR